MADYCNLSDIELIDLLKDSDHQAFTEIYRRYHYLLFVHAIKKLQDEEQAKDVIQDVFVKLWQKKQIGDTTSNLAGYLYMAVRNRIFDIFAHEKVQSKYIDSLISYLRINQHSPTEQPLTERELNDFIEKEIQALPRKMRRVFELSRKDELNYREIAQRLSTTEGNVSKQINNAIRILKVKLSMFFTLFL